MNNLLSEFPERKALADWYKKTGNSNIYDVNGHIHSPYSFSAFDNLDQAFKMAMDEQVRVLGINDFNTTEGYMEFYGLSLKYRIFPLFNIEFMGLLKDEQKRGIRINDPNNPGRIYFSGKGLDFPGSWGKGPRELVNGLNEECHIQVKMMVQKLNEYLRTLDSMLYLDFDVIKNKYTRGMVRERHIVRALRLLIEERFRTPEDRKMFQLKLYGDNDPAADILDIAAFENELRGRLLKSGGVAFVEEDPSAFLSLDKIMYLIKDAGGIPCYPVLLDDIKGWHTEFESNMEELYNNFLSWNISCIELIPCRNDIRELKKFVSFFRKKGFLILFGTEHNTPSLEPLKVSARGGVSLDEQLREISFEGACIVAAHQYLRAQGEEGYLPSTERLTEDSRKEFVKLGKAVIEKFLQ